MAEKKAQTLVRAEPTEVNAWKEAATIRGVSLNQYLVESANLRLTASGLDGFKASAQATVMGLAAATVAATAPEATLESVLIAYDLALNETPTLTGQRRWVDPIALREVFARMISDKPVD